MGGNGKENRKTRSKHTIYELEFPARIILVPLFLVPTPVQIKSAALTSGNRRCSSTPLNCLPNLQ